jgi:hypothetical protein
MWISDCIEGWKGAAGRACLLEVVGKEGRPDEGPLVLPLLRH